MWVRSLLNPGWTYAEVNCEWCTIVRRMLFHTLPANNRYQLRVTTIAGHQRRKFYFVSRYNLSFLQAYFSRVVLKYTIFFSPFLYFSMTSSIRHILLSAFFNSLNDRNFVFNLVYWTYYNNSKLSRVSDCVLVSRCRPWAVLCWSSVVYMIKSKYNLHLCSIFDIIYLIIFLVNRGGKVSSLMWYFLKSDTLILWFPIKKMLMLS